MTRLDDMVHAYLACALWTATDEHGEALDRVHTAEDFHPDTVTAARAECADFLQAASEDAATLPAEQVGHDFWLTRNRHGAGFWDRGLGEQGRRLTDLAHPYGSADVYVGDDTFLHIT